MGNGVAWTKSSSCQPIRVQQSYRIIVPDFYQVCFSGRQRPLNKAVSSKVSAIIWFLRTCTTHLPLNHKMSKYHLTPWLHRIPGCHRQADMVRRVDLWNVIWHRQYIQMILVRQRFFLTSNLSLAALLTSQSIREFDLPLLVRQNPSIVRPFDFNHI